MSLPGSIPPLAESFTLLLSNPLLPPSLFPHLPTIFSESVPLPVLTWSSLAHCLNFTGLQRLAKHYCLSKKYLPGASSFPFFSIWIQTLLLNWVLIQLEVVKEARGTHYTLPYFSSHLIAFSTLECCQLQLSVLFRVQKCNATAAMQSVTVKIYTISSHWEK